MGVSDWACVQRNSRTTQRMRDRPMNMTMHATWNPCNNEPAKIRQGHWDRTVAFSKWSRSGYPWRWWAVEEENNEHENQQHERSNNGNRKTLPWHHCGASPVSFSSSPTACTLLLTVLRRDDCLVTVCDGGISMVWSCALHQIIMK